MADIADARADRPLQPGDVVRVVGQDLHWTVLKVTYSAVLDHAGIFQQGPPSQLKVWNDIHGRQEFPPEVLERVS